MILLLVCDFIYFALYLVILGLNLFLFRRKIHFLKEDQVTTKGTIYSPVSGKVESIMTDELGRTLITLKMSLLNGFGIYLPISARINDIIFSGNEDLQIVMEDKKERKTLMSFTNAIFNRGPELIVLPGDIGKRQVDIGFYPLGGRVKITLDDVKCLVSVNDIVKGAETIICRRLEDANE